MDSGGSSSFWFCQDATPGWGTDIDVFEIGGKAKGFEHKYHMTLHVTQTPQEKKHWQVRAWKRKYGAAANVSASARLWLPRLVGGTIRKTR